MGTLTATAESFDAAVLERPGLVLVDFWAPWCGPCKALAPTLEDVAEDFEDDLAVVKVDVEAEPGAGDRFGVQAIPLLILFKDGQEVLRMDGVQSRGQLTKLIEGQL